MSSEARIVTSLCGGRWIIRIRSTWLSRGQVSGGKVSHLRRQRDRWKVRRKQPERAKVTLYNALSQRRGQFEHGLSFVLTIRLCNMLFLSLPATDMASPLQFRLEGHIITVDTESGVLRVPFNETASNSRL